MTQLEGVIGEGGNGERARQSLRGKRTDTLSFIKEEGGPRLQRTHPKGVARGREAFPGVKEAVSRST